LHPIAELQADPEVGQVAGVGDAGEHGAIRAVESWAALRSFAQVARSAPVVLGLCARSVKRVRVQQYGLTPKAEDALTDAFRHAGSHGIVHAPRLAGTLGLASQDSGGYGEICKNSTPQNLEVTNWGRVKIGRCNKKGRA
jgi:hypothetical protein